MSTPAPAVPIALTDDWLTPREIVDLLGPVALDPCAHPGSLVQADLRAILAEGVDGLALPWAEAGGLVFVNPPYSDLGVWLARCAAEAAQGAAVLALVPARLETAAFDAHVYQAGASILAIRRRLRFLRTISSVLDQAEKAAPSRRGALLRAAESALESGETLIALEGATFPSVLIHWERDPAMAAAIESQFASLGTWLGVKS